MKFFTKSLFLCGFIALTTQDIGEKKACDCTKCGKMESVNRLVEPTLGGKAVDLGKSSCNICEHRKELIRMEKERRNKLQKCPFEILGAPSLRGKTSEEIFDEFRELIVPSQNGFFDLMRGIVKTMHVSSESELQWAREKESKMKAEKNENVKREDQKVHN